MCRNDTHPIIKCAGMTPTMAGGTPTHHGRRDTYPPWQGGIYHMAGKAYTTMAGRLTYPPWQGGYHTHHGMHPTIPPWYAPYYTTLGIPPTSVLPGTLQHRG